VSAVHGGFTNQMMPIAPPTTNLTSWTPIKTNNSPFTFTDPQTTNYPRRFYRAIR